MRWIPTRPFPAALTLVLLALAATPGRSLADEPGEPAAPLTPPERIQAMIEAERSGPEGLPTIRAYLDDDDPAVRAAAVQMAYSLGGTGELDRILPLVDDDSPIVAQAVLVGMVAFEDPRVIAPVSAALREGTDPIRAQLAAAIGERQDARFVEALSALLASDKPALRRTGLEAMRATGDPSAFPYLMAATGDADGRVVATAIGGLEALGDPRARARVDLLAKSEHEIVRAAVARALPALGPVGESQSTLVALLGDPEMTVRMSVVVGLRDRHDPTSIPVLAAAARSDDDRVRRGAATALGIARGEEGAEILDRLLSDGEPAVRAVAVQSVAERALSSRLERLIAMVEDPSSQVRTVLATGLGAFDVDAAGAALQALSRDVDPSVRGAVAESAATIPDPVGNEILARLATDRDSYVRTAVVRASGKRGDAASLERLRQATTDSEIPVRITALIEIGRLGDSGSFEAVRKALSDPVEAVRDAARNAMPSVRPE